MYESLLDAYLRFINTVYVNNKVLFGGSFKSHISTRIMGTNEFFYLILANVLFTLRGYTNINDLINITDNGNLIKVIEDNLNGIVITEDDVEKFIEKNVINAGNEKIPLEILKTLKSKMIEQKTLGHLGITPGKILRNLNYNDVNYLTPILPLELQAKDTIDNFKAEYERILANIEDEAEKNNITFEKVYHKLALTHLDQVQNTILVLKAAIETNSNIYHTLHFKIPFFTKIPQISMKENVWCNRQVIDHGLESITFYLINNELSATVNSELLVINSASYPLLVYINILVTIIAKLIDVETNDIVWNVGYATIVNGDKSMAETIEELTPKQFKSIQYTIDDFSDISELTLDHFKLGE